MSNKSQTGEKLLSKPKENSPPICTKAMLSKFNEAIQFFTSYYLLHCIWLLFEDRIIEISMMKSCSYKITNILISSARNQLFG